jgi:hypothetical protein
LSVHFGPPRQFRPELSFFLWSPMPIPAELSSFLLCEQTPFML